MRSLPIRALGATIVPTLALTLLAPATPAQAATKPPLGLQFTYPSHAGGDRDKEYIDSLTRLIDGVPRGGRINASEYHLTESKPTDALVRADRRGVTVRFLTFQRNRDDDPMSDGKVRQLQSQFKGSRSGSWVKVCRYACRRSGKTGIDHQKLWSFSASGGRGYVVRVSSGNASGDSDTAAWNNWTDLADRNIYRAVESCVVSSRADRKLPQCKGASSASGQYRIDFSPRSTKADPVLSWLRDTRCPRGSGGQVRMPMWGVTIRAWVDQLVWLDGHGCDVRVVGNRSTWFGGKKSWRVGGKKVDALTYLAHRGVVVFDATRRPNGTYAGGVYIHEKTVVRWNVDEASRRGVQRTLDMVSGSANGTPSGLRYNDDVMLWDESDVSVRQQVANFNRVAGHSKRVR